MLNNAGLSARVFIVALASLLPLALLSVVMLRLNAQDHKEELIGVHEQTMRTLSAALDAELNATAASLDAFAADDLNSMNLAELHTGALALLARRPAWSNVHLSTPSGRQLMNARLPIGAQLPPGLAPEALAMAVSTGRPAVSDLVFSPVLSREVFVVHVPAHVGGKVAHVISAIVRPDSLLDLVKLYPLPEGGVVTFVDRNQRIVTRSRDAARFLGQSASGPLLDRLRSGARHGWTASTTLDGAEVFSFFHTSTATGWTVISGVPRTAISAPMWWTLFAFGASIVLSVLLGLGAAWLAGRAIVKPMRSLKLAAAQIGRGETPEAPPSTLPEVRDVSDALLAAHRERERLLSVEQQARMEAERVSRAKDEFLAMLGHELRNPLAALSSAAQIIARSHNELSPHAARASQILLRQLKHLARLTDDLLEAGRVIHGKIVLARTRMDLGAAVQASANALRETGQLSQHKAVVDITPVWIDADPTRIDQITLNLITNAIKYTPAGGSISISVREEDDAAVLEVADTGVGLDPELLPRVFELFVQGERSLDLAQGGLGIGLTLVQRLAQLHQGSVHAHSAGRGQGATFTVRFPLAKSQFAQQSRGGAIQASGSLRIALIEDNDDVRAGLRALLEADGHWISEAHDGHAGLALLREQRFDLALIDVGLPGMDGLALARAVRELDPSIRLVAMTGYGARQDKEQGAAAGFTAYFVKPIDLDELRSFMRATFPVEVSAEIA